MSLATLIEEQRLIICVGSGGVGKTTTAAAIGLAAAKKGRKVLVLTIDPARRLANSLGLSQFGNEETKIRLSAEVKGELWAMMLDTRSTFDALINRVSPDDDTRTRILNNRVYRHVSDSFGGSQEYMATEQLYCNSKEQLAIGNSKLVGCAMQCCQGMCFTVIKRMS